MSKLSLKPGWKIVKFGDIAQNVAVRIDPADAMTDVYVGLEHLDPESLHLRQWGHPSDVTGQKLVFQKGDVIFGRRRAYQRKLAIAEFDGICSAHAMVVRAKPEMILPEFLPFFLQSDMFMERAIEISVGSLSPTINWKTLRVQEFPLPPIKEQKRIAEILWAADEAVEKWISVSLAAKRLSHVFSVNSFLLHEVRKKKPNIPDGWTIGPITNLVHIDPRMPRELSDDLDVSFVPMESILETGGISSKEVKKLGNVRKGYTYFAEGDILFAKITPCMENNKGAIAENLTNEIGMGSTEFFVLKPKITSDRDFVFFLSMSKTFRQKAERWMQGSAGQRRVPRDLFEKRPIAIPPQAERERIGVIHRSLDTRIKDANQHIQLMNNARMTLLNSFLMEQLNCEVTHV